MVKPMPASTCWQCLAATPRAATGGGLGHRRGDRRGVEPGGVEHRHGRLDRDQRVGQTVADGLELGDRLVELDALERVLACHRQRPSRHPDELVRERELRELHCCIPVDRVGVGGRERAVHLDQAEIGVDPGDRARLERSGVDDRPDDQVRRTRRRRRPAHRRTRHRCVGAADRGHAPPRCRRRAHGRARTRRPDRAPTTARTRRPGARTTSRSPHACRTTAHRPSRVSATATSSASPVCSRWPRAGCARTARGLPLSEHRLAHRSFPRSRSRRAMMLRWISELPP